MKKGEDYILYIAYGNHPQAQRTLQDGLKIIQKLQEERFVESNKLAEILDLDLMNVKDRSKFYRVMSPLMGSNPLNVRFVASQRVSGKTEYYLVKDAFDATFDNVKKDIKNVIK